MSTQDKGKEERDMDAKVYQLHYRHNGPFFSSISPSVNTAKKKFTTTNFV
jgi:hypothetical protein